MGNTNTTCSSKVPAYALVLLDINGCTVSGVPVSKINPYCFTSAITLLKNETEEFVIEILELGDNREDLVIAEKKWHKSSRAKAIDAEIERRNNGNKKDHGFLCVWPEIKNGPNGGTRIGNIEQYKDLIQPGAHFAVRRRGLDYYHHYLIIDQECDDKRHYINIIQYTSVYKTGTSGGPGGKIVKEKIELRQENKTFFDFESGVYFIQKEGYPRTENEAQKVVDRALLRVGETKYSAASNNCESFATWASTGTAVCDQMNSADSFGRFIADCLDAMHIKLPQKLINSIASTICQIMTKTGAQIPNFKQAAAAVAAIIGKLKLESSAAASEAAQTLSADTLSSITSDAASSVAAEITSGIDPTFLTKAASAGALDVSNTFKNIGIGAAITLVIESIDLSIRIYNLYQQKRNGQLEEKYFKREITKACVGSASGVCFTAIGTAIGMILSPHILCVAVGGFIGGVLGKVCGPPIAGLIHDTIAEKQNARAMLA